MRVPRVQTDPIQRLRHARWAAWVASVTLASAMTCGCTGIGEYVQNGYKVGPNYGRPPAPVANEWIDAADIRKDPVDLSQWWKVFNDPTLDSLIQAAYQQNLTLRQAGFRVLEARAQLAIDTGNLLPQNQTATGGYDRFANSGQTATGLVTGRPLFASQWNYGFNLNWELDFWGRLRRVIESDAANLDASVENYDDALVTLFSDIATNYVNMRTLQERIEYAVENIELEKKTAAIAKGRFDSGAAGITIVDVYQTKSTLEQTQAEIYELEISLRQTTNALCILMGMPPENLIPRLGKGKIPVAPAEVAIGIPADLLRRRPDVRRAERQAAAQSALIGVAEAEFYPHIAVNGTVGYAAANFSDLFGPRAFTGSVGPSFTWNVLNYGRIRNNVRLQDARFQELVAAYQQAVLNAHQDAENGLVTFLKAQKRTKLQAAGVEDAAKAFDGADKQYKAGTIDLTRVTLLQQNLVSAQDTLAQAQGEIALGLIQAYKAMGGGWEIRCPPQAAQQPAGPQGGQMQGPGREQVPAPQIVIPAPKAMPPANPMPPPPDLPGGPKK